MIATSGVTLYYYNYYARIIDRRLDGEVFKRTARIYATPFLSLDLGVREIGKSEFSSGQHRKSERIVQFRYVGNF